jgi:hypothetical protein
VAPRKGSEPEDMTRRLSNIIAVVAFKEQDPEDSAIRLEALGYTAKEIGGILGKNENYLHMIKSARKSNKKGASSGKAR